MRYLIGFGHYLASDDAIGSRIVEVILQQRLEQGFSALDLGSNYLNLLNYLGPKTKDILIVDAAAMDLLPGDFRIFERSEVISRKCFARPSSHSLSLLRVLELAESTGSGLPKIYFLGIQPKTLEPGLALSPELEHRLKEYTMAAVRFFSQHE